MRLTAQLKSSQPNSDEAGLAPPAGPTNAATPATEPAPATLVVADHPPDRVLPAAVFLEWGERAEQQIKLAEP